MLLYRWESGNAKSISNSLFTIAIVSIVFKHRDFHFKIAWFKHEKKVNLLQDVYVVASHAFQQN